MAKELCMGIWRDFEAEKIAYNHRTKQICLAAQHLKQDEIYRTCAHYELESDEFFTREEKAKQFLGGKR